MNPSLSKTTVVILAAGQGVRLSALGAKPKPLIEIRGQSIIEWSISTFNRTGINNFRIVINGQSEALEERLNHIAKKYSIRINSIICKDAALGNGVSLACGINHLQGPAIVAMADHLFSPESLVSFFDAIENNQAEPSLACDPKINQIFDIDDATKVKVKDSRIIAIGKELDNYDLIDMGLFHFPHRTHDSIAKLVQEGCHSISEIVKNYIVDYTFRALVIPEASWQDVDTPSMLEHANKVIEQINPQLSKNGSKR